MRSTASSASKASKYSAPRWTDRSATEILMNYQREDGIAFAINLVILVNDGKIEGFR